MSDCVQRALALLPPGPGAGAQGQRLRSPSRPGAASSIQRGAGSLQWEQRQRQGCEEQGALTPALYRPLLRSPSSCSRVPSSPGVRCMCPVEPEVTMPCRMLFQARSPLWLPFDPSPQPAGRGHETSDQQSGLATPVSFLKIRNLTSAPDFLNQKFWRARGSLSLFNQLSGRFWSRLRFAKHCSRLPNRSTVA